MEVDANNVMHISIDSNKSTTDTTERDGWTYHRMERSSTYGQRALRLPKTADTAHVTARVANGVLSISVPKTGPQEQTRKRITVT